MKVFLSLWGTSTGTMIAAGFTIGSSGSTLALHLLRYDVLIEKNKLSDLGLYFELDKIYSLQKMDETKNKDNTFY